MFPYTLKQRKSYLDQFRNKKDLARLINDDSMMDVLLPPIPKLNLEPVRKNSKSRPKSPSSKPETSLTQPAVKNGDKNNSAQRDDDMKPVGKQKAQSSSLDVKAPEAYVGGSDVMKPQSYSEMVDEYSKTLKLSDYERQCLGFYDNSEHSLTEGELESDQIKIEDLLSKRLLGNGNKADTMKQELPADLQMELNHRAHTEENEPVDWDDNSYKNEGGESSLSKLIDSLSLNNWLNPSSDDNNNRMRRGTSETKHEPERENFLDIDEDESRINTDLLGKAIWTILDGFVCNRGHIDGDTNCFECQHKDGYKSLAMNYLEELKYIRENVENLTVRMRYEKIIEVLEVWIYHLTEQNLQLGKAYNESMYDSEKLRNFLRQSRNSFKSQQWQHDVDKSKIDSLELELSIRDKTINKLTAQSDLDACRMKETKAELVEAQTDVDSLTKLIIRLRDKGVWDINGLPIGDVTFKKIFSEDYYLHGAKVIGQKEFSRKNREWKNEIEQLKTESDTLKAIIAAKDREIQKFRSTDGTSSRNKYNSK